MEQLEALQQFNLTQDGINRQIEDSRLKINQWKCDLDELKRKDDANDCDDDDEEMGEE